MPLPFPRGPESSGAALPRRYSGPRERFELVLVERVVSGWRSLVVEFESPRFAVGDLRFAAGKLLPGRIRRTSPALP
jgi:hypothetical protein